MHSCTARGWLATFALSACLPTPAATLATTTGAADPAAAVSVTAPFVEAVPELSAFVATMESDRPLPTAMQRVEGFTTRFPRDDEPLSEATVAYLGRDTRAVHVVFLCYAKDPAAIRAHRVARDRILEDDDSVAVQIDTYRDFRRAFGLQANVAGAKQDGYWIEGSGWSLDPDFDYRTEGALTSRGYVVKYTIPFTSLDYPRGSETWGLLLMRIVPGSNETAFWPRYSRKVQGRMNQAARLEGMADAPAPSRAQLVPYFASRHTELGNETSDDLDAGLDARLRLGRSTELALAINPDFSQVESDEPQIAVNRRFELLFAEKRPFFSDHARYFATPIDLLFTRRIVDPRYGLRATGQGERTTWGTLITREVREAVSGSSGDAAADRDLFAGRVRYDATARLSFGAAAIWLGDDRERNAVGSIDTRWVVSDRWTMLGQFATSHDEIDVAEAEPMPAPAAADDGTLRGTAAEVRLQGSAPTWTYDLSLRAVSDDFRADAGFVTRHGIFDARQFTTWRHYPADSRLVGVGPDLEVEYVSDESGRRLDTVAELALVAEFARLTTVAVFGGPRQTRLQPADFPGLAQALDFGSSRAGARFETSFAFGSVALEVTRGRRINLVPPEGALPTQGRFREATLTLGLRPSSVLTNENRILYTRFDEDRGSRVFEQALARSKWSYYFTPEWSLRFIAQYQRTRANEAASRLEDDEGANLDLLMAWQPTPTRALYVGGNTDYEANVGDTGTQRTFPDRLQRRVASLYVKFSWSFDLGGSLGR